jgi:glycosyltransferase involved in cell wall biosynthesis
MRFAVDAHAIGSRLTGNEVYIRNLLTEFARLDPESEFLAYVSSPTAPAQLPAGVQTRWVSANPYRRLGVDLTKHLRRDRPSVLHVQYTGPLIPFRPLVVSLHDVSYLECPQYFTRFRAAQLRLTVRRTLRAAARVITGSEYSRRAILRHYALDESQVVVIPNAVSSRFRPMDREAAQAALWKKLGIMSPFVLTVGDLQPRKNHLGLLRAFEELVRMHPDLPHQLVFAGKETWYSPALHKAVRSSPAASRVQLAGFVDDQDLVTLYGACDAFAFPSFYEGFGLPILEAMACGRAVVCSHSTAITEVADAAAILFDPHSTAEMARALAGVLMDSDLRLRLERLGAARAAAFSWERSAARTLEVYHEVAGGRTGIASAVRAGVS